MISFKQLNYALMVAKTLHFKKASEACNVSQSALSTAISEMEKLLGFTVFERNNKQVLITEEGKTFLNKAQSIKLEMEALHQLADVNQAPLSTTMKIGVIPTIGPYLLPLVLPAVRQQYPDLKLQIVEEQSNVLVDMVRRGDLDTAILALPFPLDGLMSFEFWQEDFHWICHKDECPSGINEITAADFELEQLMLLKDGHCLKDHALNACKLQQTKVEEFSSASLYTLIQMVAGKMGTTLVPEMALQQLVHNQPEIKAIHLNEPGPHRSISFIIRPNYIKTKDIEILMTLFKIQLQNA